MLFFIVISLNYFGQKTQKMEFDSLMIKKDSLKSNYSVKKDSTKKVIDTTTILLNDSSEINIPTENNIQTKILFVKEERKDKGDIFKYLLPILTLLLGIVINKGLDYLSDRKKIKKTGERWVAEIRSLETPMKKQIETLEIFLTEHNKEVFETPQMKIFSILNCEVFKSLDKSDFLKYLELTKKLDYRELITISNKTHGYISILTYLYENLKSRFDNYLKEASSHTTSLSRNLQLLLKSFAEYGVALEKELGKDPIDDSRYTPISNLLSTHIMPKVSTGDYEVFELERKFFMPLLVVLGSLRLDERTLPLSSAVSGCLNDIKGIRMEKRYMAENIGQIINGYTTQLDELNEIIKEIEQ